MKTAKFIIVAAVIVGAWNQAYPDLINSGFEMGNFTGWSLFGQGWRISGGADAYAGSYGVVNDVQGSDVDEWRGIFQEIPITPNDEYVFSVYIRAVNVESSASWLEVRWLDTSGGIIQQLQSPSVTADQPFTLAQITATAPANAATASVRGIVRMISPPSENTDFHIFDNFAVVPEPATVGLLLLGILLGRRRILKERAS
jgi:hypothetical protein